MIARLDELSYRYPDADSPALRNVTLEIDENAFLLLAGPSAGGKSTLLRLFNGLIPQFHGGEVSGRIRIGELDPARTPTREMARIAGMVFQEPEAQSVADTVEEEIAFGMEQHGVPAPEMRQRVEALLSSLRIEHLRLRTLSTLSGGERQRVAIAAVLALEPRLLLLDEPTSQLDPAGADAVLAAIRRLHSAGNLAVMVAEHRLERLLPHVSGVIGVQGGIATEYTPRDAAARLAAVPPVCEIGRRLNLQPVPLTVAEALRGFAGRTLRVAAQPDARAPGDELLRVE
ncbi:MAG: ABC transporter ATP-binding protein, partial [Anaerolineaceae bacterium]